MAWMHVRDDGLVPNKGIDIRILSELHPNPTSGIAYVMTTNHTFLSL